MPSSCETYREDLAAEACGVLPEPEAVAVRRHLADCSACRGDLERLRAALAPLAEYRVEPPADLVEKTRRHVARGMTMRLPTAHRWSTRSWVVRVPLAAAILLAFVTFVVVPSIRPQAERRATTAQLQNLRQALELYAQAHSGTLPPESGWAAFLRKFLDSNPRLEATTGRPEWPDNLVFMEGLSNWFRLSDSDILFLDCRPEPGAEWRAVLRGGEVRLLSETEALQVLWNHAHSKQPGL